MSDTGMNNGNGTARAEGNGKTLTIGLLWHSFHSDNLGVGALSQSQVAICTDVARSLGIELSFIVFGTRGGSSYGLDDRRIEVGSRIVLRELVNGSSTFAKEVERCDLVLDIGEGDSFADIYGFKRFFTFLLTKIIVLRRRKPLVLSPQTIGPFESWYARWSAVQVMNRCHKVFARDALSSDYLKRNGVDKNTGEVVDVAFRLPFEPARPTSDGRVRIGLNVSGLLFSGGYEGTNQFGLTLDYPKLIRALLQAWTADPRHEVWLVPHVITKDLPRDDDRAISAALIEEFPTVRLAPAFASPSDAKSFIATLDFLTGARMHACIAAFSAGVPVVPLAYSRKFNGLFSMLGYPWVADAKAQSNEDAFAKINEGLVRRSELAQAVREGNRIANARLDAYARDLAAIFTATLERAR